jgi:hypothetical protein
MLPGRKEVSLSTMVRFGVTHGDHLVLDGESDERDPGPVFSSSSSSNACRSSVGVAEDETSYVLDYYRAHIDFPAQVKQVEAQALVWKPYKIAIESNAYQKALPQWLRQGHLPVVEEQVTISGKDYHLYRHPEGEPDDALHTFVYALIADAIGRMSYPVVVKHLFGEN